MNEELLQICQKEVKDLLSKDILQKDVKNLASKQIFARWQAILSVFDFEIEYLKGSENALPDYLTQLAPKSFAYPSKASLRQMVASFRRL
ncbi:unnamed protein product [Trifolium pratense]|uniref:Uncharacterized protein n=1 Tax=Trifolium pratense TaxID=57577 RepID=A0ACB0JES7_TRIPR|nr:unnamed protein product [Trifolium pratense]